MNTSSIAITQPQESIRKAPEQRPQENQRPVSKNTRAVQDGSTDKSAQSEKVSPQESPETTQEPLLSVEGKDFATLVQVALSAVTPAATPKEASVDAKLPTETPHAASLEPRPVVGLKNMSIVKGGKSDTGEHKDTQSDPNASPQVALITQDAQPGQQEVPVVSDKPLSVQAPAQAAPTRTETVLVTQDLDPGNVEAARQSWAPVLIKRAGTDVSAQIDTPVGQVQVTGKMTGSEASVVISAPVALRPQLSQDGQMPEFQEGSYRWDWQQEQRDNQPKGDDHE